LILKQIQKYNDDYHLVMHATDFDVIRTLFKNKPCRTVEDYQNTFQGFSACPLAHICFEPKMVKKELKRAWEDKEENFLSLNRPRYLVLSKL
jgi:coproporphyrinogen III oxidase